MQLNAINQCKVMHNGVVAITFIELAIFRNQHF